MLCGESDSPISTSPASSRSYFARPDIVPSQRSLSSTIGELKCHFFPYSIFVCIQAGLCSHIHKVFIDDADCVYDLTSQASISSVVGCVSIAELVSPYSIICSYPQRRIPVKSQVSYQPTGKPKGYFIPPDFRIFTLLIEMALGNPNCVVDYTWDGFSTSW